MRIRWNVRYVALIAAAATAVATTGCAGGDDGGPAGAEERHYLSLGDSLTVGVQPGENGPGETPDGYTDILYRTLYDADSTLRHERGGCGGEDTTTFLEGGIPHCGDLYEGRSQIEVAEGFLSEHAGRVDLVTLTIGGNNFTRCVRGIDGAAGGDRPVVDTECVDDGLERIETEIPVIASRLRAAAGPDTQIIAMTYYNPFLAAMLLEPETDEDAEEEGEEGSDEPAESASADEGPRLGEVEGDIPFDATFAGYATDVLETMNESLRSAYAAEDIDVADVEAAFDSTDFDVPADGTMPTNLKAICDFTWMCNADLGPDIHTNKAGATVIAEEFAGLVR
ncbi:GDSL-type esterase/lipase family protein [Nocardiopsis lambiniae]|uniref:GDSL-type esterase/lipase family protein n=1 Tax=Nocardiopsis lambiniae TaxID=3075539 RepID=A0ABU2M8U4_9ACTN|nr:GDSL-type esterase/lipase family protein [Nocardiopsis sp. DSM 44743]MDT0329093.1 GDSL-type esterase/lipase family protein [Nocardiopsis sp. DSM 44743]